MTNFNKARVKSANLPSFLSVDPIPYLVFEHTLNFRTNRRFFESYFGTHPLGQEQ